MVLAAAVTVAFGRIATTQPFTVEDALEDYRTGREATDRAPPDTSPDAPESEQSRDDEAPAGAPDELTAPPETAPEQERQAEQGRQADQERATERERQAERERQPQEAQRERREERTRQQERASRPSLVRPEPGVYRYRTDGEGRVDMAGARHTYPEETTITVRHDECGYTTRWRPIAERWEETELCLAADHLAVGAMTSYREFMGQSVHSEMSCDERFYLVPPDPQAGTTWTGRCRDEANDMRTTVHGEVVRRGTVEAAGERVEALHLRFEAEVTGDSEGYYHVERIVAAETGLLLHASSQTEVTSDGPMGSRVTYREEYTLDLLDQQPGR